MAKIFLLHKNKKTTKRFDYLLRYSQNFPILMAGEK